MSLHIIRARTGLCLRLRCMLLLRPTTRTMVSSSTALLLPKSRVALPLV